VDQSKQAVRKAETEKKPKDVSGKSIQARLENWGRCQRGATGGGMRAKETRSVSPYGGQGYKCITAVVCNILASGAVGKDGRTSTRSNLDFNDSEVITKAWLQMPDRQKTLLKWVYALNAPVLVICRRLEIRHWPASHFSRELKSAENIIQRIVDKAQNKTIISGNSFPSDKMSDTPSGGVTVSGGNGREPISE
jgi:hypothetical protein